MTSDDINKKNYEELNGEELATWLHENYETFAKQFGWKTQEKTRVPFNKLPIENQRTMLYLAQSIMLNMAEVLIRKKKEGEQERAALQVQIEEMRKVIALQQEHMKKLEEEKRALEQQLEEFRK